MTNELLMWLGRAAGWGGLLLCLGAGALRLTGQYWLAGFQVITLLQAGMAAMIAGCFFLLTALTRRPDD